MLSLVRRNLAHYWRTNLAVVLGVGVAVSVLAGALLVGDSVRASLRGLFLKRLGRASLLVNSTEFFRERLAEGVSADGEFARGGFTAACPVVLLGGALTHEESGRRASGVQVYGVDERFWKFHGSGAVNNLGAGEVLLSRSLSGEVGARAGEAVLLRIENPSEIPVESLHGREEDVGRTMRLTVGEQAEGAAEFSVRPSQAGVRAAFVPLRSLQKSIGREGQANAILVSAEGEEEGQARAERLRAVLRRHAAPEDVGVRLRALDGGRGLSLETESAIVGDPLAEAAREAAARSGMGASPVLSYLANTVRAGGREIPYSLVTAVDADAFGRLRGKAAGTENDIGVVGELPPIILNDWAAKDLGLTASAGETVELDYYLWQEGGRLKTETARFRLAGVVPLEGEAADRDLVPEYTGITEAKSLADWDPPFPVELARVRPADEAYWHEHRTTPKAFITIERGQELWGSRFGRLTSVRARPPEGADAAQALEDYRRNLLAVLDPTRAGLSVYDVRAEGLDAARGATDFGEYFLYFSFFLVASALLLTALFFRLGVEQRLREIGVLRAVGFPASRVRAIFLWEGLVLAAAGSLLGLAGAYAYGRLIMHGLRTWWVGAVGTTALELHAAPPSFLLGGAGGVVAALLCIVLTLRGLARSSARSLLAGGRGEEVQGGIGARRRLISRLPFVRLPLFAPVLFGALGVGLLVAAAAGWVGQAAGFFGGGTLLLVALLALQSAWLRRGRAGGIGDSGARAVAHLGARNATHRPGRSVLCITLIASAAFVIVAVDAFRREGRAAARDRKSGDGGYQLMAESLLPVVHDPNTPEGRDALNLTAPEENDGAGGVKFARFRLRPGDDASCLNLYRPRQPRILAPTPDFLREGRFSFQNSLAATNEEKANPWLLLERDSGGGAIHVAADANSAAYVLHMKLGDEFTLERGAGAEPVRLRLVATLSDSVFQGELVM
ncbi:MAG TPA: FtsX-like permease family protein, partial [Pyrinomonadaceae bacterium]|nr:FtsX-like permease family protein [Pyrinomonadaceae bacterium]